MQRHLSVKRGIKLKEINDASIDSGRAFFLKSWYNASFLLLTGAAEPAIAFTVMLLVTDGGAGKGVWEDAAALANIQLCASLKCSTKIWQLAQPDRHKYDHGVSLCTTRARHDKQPPLLLSSLGREPHGCLGGERGAIRSLCMRNPKVSEMCPWGNPTIINHNPRQAWGWCCFLHLTWRCRRVLSYTSTDGLLMTDHCPRFTVYVCFCTCDDMKCSLSNNPGFFKWPHSNEQATLRARR